MRTYAAEVITANFDGIWNGNNYFLYLHEDGRIHYYRQDLGFFFLNFLFYFISFHLFIYSFIFF